MTTIEYSLRVMYNLGVKHSQEMLRKLSQMNCSIDEILEVMEQMKKPLEEEQNVSKMPKL